jgi:hypothetical protein
MPSRLAPVADALSLAGRGDQAMPAFAGALEHRIQKVDAALADHLLGPFIEWTVLSRPRLGTRTAWSVLRGCSQKEQMGIRAGGMCGGGWRTVQCNTSDLSFVRWAEVICETE